jgi:SAM-dependent methyltransferase
MRSVIKTWAKRLIPERYRMLRYEWYQVLRYYPELVLSLGRRLECPFCGWRFRRLRSAGFDYPILKEQQVVGASCHPDDVCPRCMSNARERLVYLYLKDKTSVFSDRLRVLHIAPEPHLTRTLRCLAGVDYVTGDLMEQRVDVKLDVMMLPFPDDSFDVIICNHVLEHVANDRVAMSELHRVLRPGGPALLQVPIAMALGDTLEDPTAVTEAERIRLFGQRDHVRLYAAGDYMRRLEAVGFRVSLTSAVDCLGEDAVARYALLRDEPVFVCRAAASWRLTSMGIRSSDTPS